MKGIIQAYAFFVLWVGLSLSFMALARFDHTQYLNQLILKQALSETALQLRTLSVAERSERYGDFLAEALRVRQPPHTHYHIHIMGFHPHPLALRVRLDLDIDAQLIHYTHRFDETIIEVHHED